MTWISKPVFEVKAKWETVFKREAGVGDAAVLMLELYVGLVSYVIL